MNVFSHRILIVPIGVQGNPHSLRGRGPFERAAVLIIKFTHKKTSLFKFRSATEPAALVGNN